MISLARQDVATERTSVAGWSVVVHPTILAWQTAQIARSTLVLRAIRSADLGGWVSPCSDGAVATCPRFDSDPAAKPSSDLGTNVSVISTETHDHNACEFIQPNH